MTARSASEILGAVDTLRDGLLALAGLLGDAGDLPPKHQLAALVLALADQAELVLGDAAPVSARLPVAAPR